MNKASVLSFQVVKRAVNQHQGIDAVPGLTVLGQSSAGTGPGEEDHRGCAAGVSGRASEKTPGPHI